MPDLIAAAVAALGSVAFFWSTLRTRRRMRALREQRKTWADRRAAFIREEHERRKGDG